MTLRMREIAELGLGDPENVINIGKVRSPIQLLMRIDEAWDAIEWGCPEGYGVEQYCEQAMALDDGARCALLYALKHTQAQVNKAAHGNFYTSWGDDTRDLYESGWDAAMQWSAGEFEWDAEGRAYKLNEDGTLNFNW